MRTVFLSHAGVDRKVAVRLEALRDMASDLWVKAEANEASILLPIDQAEELFGASDPARARSFLKVLNITSTVLSLVLVPALYRMAYRVTEAKPVVEAVPMPA
jgi:hypothetical protein